MNDYLEHYGVKGMKWGVRKYQNYDGTYTKRGLERYRKAESDYESAKDNLKRTKQSYKQGTSSRVDVRSASKQVKLEKRRMENAYKKLKTDKMADEGRELYKSGKTITGNMQRTAIAQAAIVAGGNIATKIIANKIGNLYLASLSGYAITIGGTAVNAIITGKNNRDNKRLRAYYAH